MMGDSDNTFFSSCYDPHAFFYVSDPVDWDRNLLLQAAGPSYLHSVKLVCLPQPEVYAPRALSGIAIAAVNLTDLPHPTGFNGYAGANCIPVRPDANQFELDPIAARLGDVVEEKQGLISIDLHQV